MTYLLAFEIVEDGALVLESGCYGSSHDLFFVVFASIECEEDECPSTIPNSIDLQVQCATGALGKILGATGLSVWLILLILLLVGLFIFGVVVLILQKLGMPIPCLPCLGNNVVVVDEDSEEDQK